MIAGLLLLALLGLLAYGGITGTGVHDSRDTRFNLRRTVGAARRGEDVDGPRAWSP